MTRYSKLKNIKQMLPISSIAARQIINACVSNLKQSNIDVQKDELSKKGRKLLFEVSLILPSGRKSS